MASNPEKVPAGGMDEGDPAKSREISPEMARRLVEDLSAGRKEAVLKTAESLHNADLAELIGLISPEERRMLIALLREGGLDPAILPELAGPALDEVVEHLEPEEVADAVGRLESDDAVHVLEDMDQEEQRGVLKHLSESGRVILQTALDCPEGSAGRLMRTGVVAVPPFWSVGQTIDYMRESDALPDNFYEIFVIDPAFRPVGTLPLSRVMRTRREVSVSEIMSSEQTLIPAELDREEVAYRFEKYNLVSAAVVKGGRLAGVITADDVVEVATEAADEDIGLLGGVRDESLSDSVLRISASRFNWLFLNLLTAILASLVISFFDRQIHAMVSLAILMPIVASMGGNAATQTLTVAVRALARRDLMSFNARRIVMREALVGVVNGLTFAAVMGTLGGVWFASAGLGLILAAALIVNMIVAALAGILIPLGLERLKIDPAIASGVFVTTVTDVVGFFSFLGLAAWLLL